jgi:hypothetical protein
MTDPVYRGVVRGGVVVIREEGMPLTEGTEVFVTPAGDPRGSPAAVLAAVETSPPVPAAWVDELDQLIARGRRPPTRHDPFGDATARPEGR